MCLYCYVLTFFFSEIELVSLAAEMTQSHCDDLMVNHIILDKLLHHMNQRIW